MAHANVRMNAKAKILTADQKDSAYGIPKLAPVNVVSVTTVQHLTRNLVT